MFQREKKQNVYSFREEWKQLLLIQDTKGSWVMNKNFIFLIKCNMISDAFCIYRGTCIRNDYILFSVPFMLVFNTDKE